MFAEGKLLCRNREILDALANKPNREIPRAQ